MYSVSLISPAASWSDTLMMSDLTELLPFIPSISAISYGSRLKSLLSKYHFWPFGIFPDRSSTNFRYFDFLSFSILVFIIPEVTFCMIHPAHWKNRKIRFRR